MLFFYILTLFHINLKYCKQDDGENMGCLSLPSSRFNKCLHVAKLHQIFLNKVLQIQLQSHISISFSSLLPERQPLSSSECCYPSALEVFILFLELYVPIIYSIVLCAFKYHIKSFCIFLCNLNFFYYALNMYSC